MVCVSEDMSPYCSADDEWLITKLCKHVGYQYANNVSNVCGDPVTKLNLNTFKKKLSFCIPKYAECWISNMIGRTYFGGDQVSQLN